MNVQKIQLNASHVDFFIVFLFRFFPFFFFSHSEELKPVLPMNPRWIFSSLSQQALKPSIQTDAPA